MNNSKTGYRVLASRGADPATRATVDITFETIAQAQRCKAICVSKGYSACVKIEVGQMVKVEA
jgi:hypothetical protein